jgi:hypothetical protein
VVFSGITPFLYRLIASFNVPSNITAMDRSMTACAVHISRYAEPVMRALMRLCMFLDVLVWE